MIPGTSLVVHMPSNELADAASFLLMEGRPVPRVPGCLPNKDYVSKGEE